MTQELGGLEFERPILELEAKMKELQSFAASENMDFSEELKVLEERVTRLRQEIYGNLAPWQRVQMARHPKRLYTLDYIRRLSEDFVELHGDRLFGDDQALIGGFGTFRGKTVLMMGHQKGRTVQESMKRNFGMPHPEGYRKALRLMQLAEKFRCPVISFIDTPGAYPGIGAEERGQAEAIARNLREMSVLSVPIISVVIGEGGSGGALGIGVSDRILMLENAWYSVISPEGCAAILYHDAGKAQEAAGALKLTAQELLALGIIEEIVPEPLGGVHTDPESVMSSLEKSLAKHLEELLALPPQALVEKRYEKFRRVGQFAQKETVERPKKKSRRL